MVTVVVNSTKLHQMVGHFIIILLTNVMQENMIKVLQGSFKKFSNISGSFNTVEECQNCDRKYLLHITLAC